MEKIDNKVEYKDWNDTKIMKHTCHLDFVDFSQANIKRCEEVFHPLDSWSLSDWATAAVGELGEACNLIKKLNRGENIPLDLIAEELADCVTYIDLLATRMEKELMHELIKKFNKVSDKKGSDEYLWGNAPQR